MSENTDYLYALELQKRWNAGHESLSSGSENSGSDIEEIVDFKPPPPSKKPLQVKRSNPHSNLDEDFLNRTQNLVHPMWETLDPTPDVNALFVAFDTKFFQSRLRCVTLEWSKRMYSCAGICYSRRNRFGMDVTIRLSEPLLKLRPRKDLIETMLHEMIHAYCFVLHIREGNGGHGPNFKKIMYAINKVAGTNITVYHTFHDEVDIYKQHWWRCNGMCQNRSPFYGYVKRTCNRAPSANDQWWAAHKESCGGTFMKIKEPEKPKRQKTAKGNNKERSIGSDLRKFFPTAYSSTQNDTANTRSNKTNFNTKMHTVSNIKDDFKGPIKSNGGGTMVLKPKTANPITKTTPKTQNLSDIAKAFPPSSYPGLSTDPFGAVSSPRPSLATAGGNLNNVKGFRDLNSSSGDTQTRPTSFNKSTSNISMEGHGYSLSSNNSQVAGRDHALKMHSNDSVDREKLREVWSKRFGLIGSNDSQNTTASDGAIDPSIDGSNDLKAGDSKRRRLSSDINENNSKKQDWIKLDEDVMLREQKEEIIALSSDDEEKGHSDSDGEAPTPRPFQRPKKLTADERQNAIKQEILDETIDLEDRDDIVLIDDDYDDNVDVSGSNELTDNAIVDEFFGDDTLLRDFMRENDVRPTFSRYVPNPEDDIITCPICQGKMKRSLLEEHLNGCTGIAVRIEPPKHALKKLASSSREVRPTRKPRVSRDSVKDILRNAGYTDQDLINITSASSAEEEEFLNSSGLSSSPLGSQQGSNSTPTINITEDEQNTRSYRQRNIFKTTRQCPVCADEIEDDEMNDHLDSCLEKRKGRRKSKN